MKNTILPIVLITIIVIVIYIGSNFLTHEPNYPIFIFMFGLFALYALYATTRFLFGSRKSLVVFLLVSASLSMSLVAIEVTARLMINYLPKPIFNKFKPVPFFEQRHENFVLLEHSPYIKFAPNVCIRQHVYPQKDYDPYWCTDKRGFKNKPELLEEGNIDLVAAGDSFTEGMGMPVEATWASLLTARGIRTYSVGVQGYSTQMALGSLKHFGIDLKPKYVLYGCSNGCVYSNAAYADPDTGRPLGNIGLVMQRELERRGRVRYKLAVSAIVHAGLASLEPTMPGLARVLFYPLGTSLKAWWRRATRKAYEAFTDDPKQAQLSKKAIDRAIGLGANPPEIIRRYKDEIGHYAALKVSEGNEFRHEIWLTTRQDILGMARLAKDIGAKFGVIMFPYRGITYYEAFVGPFPEDSLFVYSRKIMREFCQENGFRCIDLHDPIVTYLRTIGQNSALEAFPYFIQDSHMNSVGHRIVADEVEALIRGGGL